MPSSAAPAAPLPPLPRGRLADRMERAVIGADYGADGYTTRAQVDALAGHLRLRPGDRLLDLGSGRGWPGLHLAARTGCSVVLTDLPHGALVAAADRARADGLDARVAVVRATGGHLPFRTGTFDALSHTDVLC